MNKRQKKKQEKKEVIRLYEAWNSSCIKERNDYQKNGEGYPDPTAYKAMINCMKKGNL